MDFFSEFCSREPTLPIQYRYPASDTFKDRLPTDLDSLLSLKRQYNCQILDSIECDLDRAAELKHLATHVRYRILVLKSMSADAEFIQEYERQLPLMKWRPTPDVVEVLTTDPQVHEDGDKIVVDTEDIDVSIIDSAVASRQLERKTSDEVFVVLSPEEAPLDIPIMNDELISPVVSPFEVMKTAFKRSNDRGLRVKRSYQKDTDFLYINENLVELETVSAVSDNVNVHRGRIKPSDVPCRLVFDNNSGCGKSLIKTFRNDKWKRLKRMSHYEAELYHLFTGHILIVGKNYTMVRISSSGFNENVSEWMHDDSLHRHVAF